VSAGVGVPQPETDASNPPKEVGVAFPEESMSEGEVVRLHLHPHWITVFWPVVAGIVLIAGGAAGAIATMSSAPFVPGAIGVVALVLFVWWFLTPYVKWRSTHYVFTSKQVLLREGVIKRLERGIPLGKVNDVRTTQGLMDRILRSGTIEIESAGTEGQSTLVRIPHAIAVAKQLQELREQDQDSKTLDEGEMRELLKENREAGGKL
jgi:uncharacterized membrane protein YdbT with pleckstrin-like domain